MGVPEQLEKVADLIYQCRILGGFFEFINELDLNFVIKLYKDLRLYKQGNGGGDA